LEVAPLQFLPSESYRPQVDAVLHQISSMVQQVLPDADVQDMGSTAVPGALTKGDLDVNVRVSNRKQFHHIVEWLRSRFPVHQPENWTASYASFADEHEYELPVGIQVTIRGDVDDKFVCQRDRLASSPELLAMYNNLKMTFESGDVDAYREAKWAFIEEHLCD
jgi:GrpB-like predicted nucleotidyltransferase (UPF0157 family)